MDTEVTNNKVLAINMLKPYIERGETIQQTKAGQMGTFTTDGSAQVGGYVNGKKYSTDYVITVTKDNKIQSFKLKDIFNEVLSDQTKLF